MSVLSTVALLVTAASPRAGRIAALEKRVQELENALAIRDLAMAQQLEAQRAQMTLEAAMVYGRGARLGAQTLALEPQLWCNCVPSRAQVWAATAQKDDTGEAS